MEYPIRLKKLAKRLINEAMKLFPNDDAKQEEWFLDQFVKQCPEPTKNLEWERRAIAAALREATQDAYEAFPYDQERAVVRILELMGWDNDPEMRETAQKALNMFRTDPLFAEDRAIRT